jgi:hypothetical protein
MDSSNLDIHMSSERTRATPVLARINGGVSLAPCQGWRRGRARKASSRPTGGSTRAGQTVQPRPRLQDVTHALATN